MGHILLRVFPDGRVERLEQAESWRDREELIAYSLFLQPALAALDVSAKLWQELTGPGPSRLRRQAPRPGMHEVKS